MKAMIILETILFFIFEFFFLSFYKLSDEPCISWRD